MARGPRVPPPFPGGLQMSPLQNLALPKPGHYARSLTPPCARWVPGGVDAAREDFTVEKERYVTTTQGTPFCASRRRKCGQCQAKGGQESSAQGVLGKGPSWAAG